MPEFTGHRDVRSYIRAIWRWKVLIVVLVLGAPAVSYLLERKKQPTYAASALVSVNINASSQSSNGNPFAEGNIAAIARILTTTPVANIAGQQMKPRVSGSAIVGDVSASADVTTNLITISATAGNPDYAADVANAFARAVSAKAHIEAIGAIQSQVRSLQAQLSRLPASSSERPALQDELLNLRASLAAPSGSVSVLQNATPDTTPTGPHKRRAIELGLVIGILLAIAGVMLLDSADRRLRSPDDLEEFTKLPLLAAIAPTAFDGDLETTPVDEESFQTLRTSLTYFTVDKKVKSVLVTSPGEQEGKSTVAVRLALASARAGLDVVLVDADLRRAGSTAKLGLQPKLGLGVVLAEGRPVETALIDWPMGPDGTGRLRVLASGSPPPNPAALISSAAMRQVIATLEDQSDLVIIDTPAALAVSDAVPLMPNVSGIVLVARMNRSSRDTVRRLQKMILSTNGLLLGTVATGVTSGPGYEKYSQAYYAPAGPDGRRGRRDRRHKDKAGPRSQPARSVSREVPADDVPANDVPAKDVPESIAALRIRPYTRSKRTDGAD
jgi:capsular exopolysaccharide synthesis family protein